MADASPSGDWTINNPALIELVKLAGTVAQYDLVRRDANQEAVLTDANVSAEIYGMVLNAGVDDEYAMVAKNGARLTISSGGFTADSFYFVSETAGKSAPLGDIATGGAHKTRAFWAHSATDITLDFHQTGDTA